MKICILGLGVIGTTYGYAFQKAGHEIEHLVRPEKREKVPKELSISLLDSRYHSKGETRQDTYQVTLAEPNTKYDFIILSVAKGAIKSAVEALKSQGIKGTLVLFCNFWNTRQEIEDIVGGYPYVLAFPVAGGSSGNSIFNLVLLNHVMLERKENTSIANYSSLVDLFTSADLKLEFPHDMVEWIWIHMAINAGVVATIASLGDISNPSRLANSFMDSSADLSKAVKTIRETVRVAESRGVNLKNYRGELLPYKVPAWLAGKVMKKMFANNQPARKIMTLHNDIDDILYGCRSVYHTGKQNKVNMPIFDNAMKRVESKLD